MQAAVVAIGSELLGVERLDTNSLFLTGILERYGVVLRRKSVVGDDVDAIALELEHLATEVDLVLITGGLGPTADDVTREAVAKALGRTLALDPAVLNSLEERFRRHGIEMPSVNRKQAEVLSGATLISNPRGTAPGQIVQHGSCTFFLMPGVPREMKGMVEGILVQWLETRWDGGGIERRVLKVACLPESRVEQHIGAAYEEFGREWITVLAKPAEIHIFASARGSVAEREDRLGTMQRRLRALVGDAVFSAEEDGTLESVIGALLAERGATVATAESCTGGLVAERLTRVPGSSAYFRGGAVTYANSVKESVLEVPRSLLDTAGAVSEEVALAMARGACHRFSSTYGIGITGIAGPGGGTELKPTGTVHIAVCGPEDESRHRVGVFPGDRERVRVQSGQWALDLLRRLLLGMGDVS